MPNPNNIAGLNDGSKGGGSAGLNAGMMGVMYGIPLAGLAGGLAYAANQGDTPPPAPPPPDGAVYGPFKTPGNPDVRTPMNTGFYATTTTIPTGGGGYGHVGTPGNTGFWTTAAPGTIPPGDVPPGDVPPGGMGPGGIPGGGGAVSSIGGAAMAGAPISPATGQARSQWSQQLHDAMMTWVPGQTMHPLQRGSGWTMGMNPLSLTYSEAPPPTWNPYENVMAGNPAGYPTAFNDQGMIPNMPPPPNMPVPPAAQQMAPVSQMNPPAPAVPAGDVARGGGDFLPPYASPQSPLMMQMQKQRIGGGFGNSAMSPQNYLEQLVNSGARP